MHKDRYIPSPLTTSFFPMLFITFLVMKLTGIIAWSWWWITAPLWLPFVLGFAAIIVAFTIFLIILVTCYSNAPDEDMHDNRK